MKIAVILFPGTNCELETKQALEACGMSADIFRWNLNPEKLEDYDGYVLPGGWSYEDRIRAGVIASKDSIMKKIKEEAKKGKAVLGICNGAQILVESGLIPGLKDEVEIALAPNNKGYLCTWVHIKNNGKNAFNAELKENEVIPLPIAHGEGRFVTQNKNLIDELIKKKQIVFSYCDEKGIIKEEYPINPNGATYNLAGICNEEGNILAMMPHPERATWNRQLPGFEGKSFEENLS